MAGGKAHMLVGLATAVLLRWLGVESGDGGCHSVGYPELTCHSLVMIQ